MTIPEVVNIFQNENDYDNLKNVIFIFNYFKDWSDIKQNIFIFSTLSNKNKRILLEGVSSSTIYVLSDLSIRLAQFLNIISKNNIREHENILVKDIEKLKPKKDLVNINTKFNFNKEEFIDTSQLETCIKIWGYKVS